MNNNLVYILDDKVYINLTNACTNNCIFCLRQQKDDVEGTNMWLVNENYPVEDVINQLIPFVSKFNKGITFCGYGEPTVKLDALIYVSKFIKSKYPGTYIKVNTNGHGNVINKKNILPDLIGLVDEFSISLNAPNEELYNELSQPKIPNAYRSMLEFAKMAVEYDFKTTLSVVSEYEDFDVDLIKCQEISNSIGAEFRNRPFIPNGY